MSGSVALREHHLEAESPWSFFGIGQSKQGNRIDDALPDVPSDLATKGHVTFGVGLNRQVQIGRVGRRDTGQLTPEGIGFTDTGSRKIEGIRTFDHGLCTRADRGIGAPRSQMRTRTRLIRSVASGMTARSDAIMYSAHGSTVMSFTRK